MGFVRISGAMHYTWSSVWLVVQFTDVGAPADRLYIYRQTCTTF